MTSDEVTRQLKVEALRSIKVTSPIIDERFNPDLSVNHRDFRQWQNFLPIKEKGNSINKT